MANAIMLKSGLALPSNIGVVDLGDINWAYDAAIPRFRSTNFDMNKVKVVEQGSMPHILHILQETYNRVARGDFSRAPDKSICYHFNSSHYTGGWIEIKDLQYTVASEFKQAVKGLLMFYEKAEEI